ncbi:hypothetical protein AGR8A_pTi10005 [Agrobacterium fabrum str. J-07]|nr:hypothetical protein AGR8A_pTi10005 [Agrobacterium fabrum str. J-07]
MPFRIRIAGYRQTRSPCLRVQLQSQACDGRLRRPRRRRLSRARPGRNVARARCRRIPQATWMHQSFPFDWNVLPRARQRRREKHKGVRRAADNYRLGRALHLPNVIYGSPEHFYGVRRCFFDLATPVPVSSPKSAQYVSIRYSERLAEAGIVPSVGSVGDSYDSRRNDQRPLQG